MDTRARLEAQKLWNSHACGELAGDAHTPEYFLRVEQDRFSQQAWTKPYFRYDQFAGKSVLEIGVGQGTDLAQFASSGAICSGVDITENHLRLTEENLRSRSLAADLRLADATKLPFADSTFDCVYSFGVLHHIPEVELVAQEIQRVLKPRGLLMFSVYNVWSGYWLINKCLVQGILKARLLTIGMRGLKATIESGADGESIVPYVRLYSRSGVRRLLGDFDIENISVHQLYGEHVLPLRIFKSLAARPLPLSGLLGWYVAAKAHKPA